MKHTLRWIAAAALLYACCVLFSFVVAPRLAEGIWKQLGITQQTGNDKPGNGSSVRNNSTQ
jgi:hypothetical protein